MVQPQLDPRLNQLRYRLKRLPIPCGEAYFAALAPLLNGVTTGIMWPWAEIVECCKRATHRPSGQGLRPDRGGGARLGKAGRGRRMCGQPEKVGMEARLELCERPAEVAGSAPCARVWHHEARRRARSARWPACRYRAPWIRWPPAPDLPQRPLGRRRKSPQDGSDCERVSALERCCSVVGWCVLQ